MNLHAHKRSVRLGLSLWTILGSVWACSCENKETVDLKTLELKVLYAGCDGVKTGPICEYKESNKEPTVTLWIETDADAKLEFDVGGVETKSEIRELAGGRSVTVSLPTGATGTLNVSAQLENAKETWQLALGKQELCPVYEEAKSLRQKGKSQEALDALAKAEPTKSDFCKGMRTGLEGRLYAYDLEKNEEGIELLQKSFKAKMLNGNLYGSVKDTQGLAFLWNFKTHEFDKTRDTVASVIQTAAQFPEAHLKTQYVLGQLAYETGNLRDALRKFEEVEKWSERFQMIRLLVDTRQELAGLLSYLGRHDEAINILRKVQKLHLDQVNVRVQSTFWTNYGWVQFLKAQTAARNSKQDYSEAEESLRNAVRLFESEWKDPFIEAIAYLNLAMVSLYKNDLDETARWLHKAENVSDKSTEFLANWFTEIRGRMAIKQNNFDTAIDIFGELRSRSAPLTEMYLKSYLGEAEALYKQGRNEFAIKSLYKVEKLLDEHIRLIPVNAGQGSFLLGKDENAGRLIELLLKKGLTEDALAVARRSRSRVVWELERDSFIDSLSATDILSWEKSVDRYKLNSTKLSSLHAKLQTAAQDEQVSIKAEILELEKDLREAIDKIYSGMGPSSLADIKPLNIKQGEIVLLYHPWKDGVFSFAISKTKIIAHFVPSFDCKGAPTELSKLLLSPFEELLSNADRVKIMTQGALEQIDFHSLPFGDDVLLSQTQVSYSIDLPEKQISKQTPAQNYNFLIVADPTGDLAGARESVSAITAILSKKRFKHSILLQDKATKERFKSSLEDTSWLHFSGHGEHKGDEGWGSALLLADLLSFTVSDILTLKTVPDTVFLAACESGKTTEKGPAATLGLGQAFVMTGSSVAIVSTRPLKDSTGLKMTKLIYEEPLGDAVEALRKAQLKLKNACNDCDWAAFRAVVR